MRRPPVPLLVPTLVGLVLLALTPNAGAVGILAPKGQEVRQPALKVFINWDADKRSETLILQPEFESKSDHLALIVAVPAKPEIGAVPRGFFRDLAAFTLLKRRAYPESRLLPQDEGRMPGKVDLLKPARVRALDDGFVPVPKFELFDAGAPAGLEAWLKQNNVTVDPKALAAYAEKKWTVAAGMLDLKGLKKDRDGNYAGTVSPFRLTFAAEQPTVPLGLAATSANVGMDTLLYVQAGDKMDLPGDLSYQYYWVQLLQNAQAESTRGVPGKGEEWLTAIQDQVPELRKKSDDLGFRFVKNQRPQPNRQGQSVATLEWAKRLTPGDIQALKGAAPLAETVPDPDEGFTEADTDSRNPTRRDAAQRAIKRKLEEYRKLRPGGYLVTDLSADEVRQLKELAEDLRAERFLTKIRKTLTADEIKGDLIFRPAQVGKTPDVTEYEERLPGSP